MVSTKLTTLRCLVAFLPIEAKAGMAFGPYEARAPYGPNIPGPGLKASVCRRATTGSGGAVSALLADDRHGGCDQAGDVTGIGRQDQGIALAGQLGEGIEKKQEDFAAEVAAQMK